VSRKRRYTRDHLIYESFYVSIVNALVVSLAPLGIFVMLAAIENYAMNKAFWLSTFSMTQFIFIIAFFINFFYYAFFIRARKFFTYSLAIVLSALLGMMTFLSDIGAAITDIHQAAIIVSWFTLLVMMLVANRIGLRDHQVGKYDHQSWLLKHELAENGEAVDDDDHDLAGDYVHRYINHHDENAPERKNKTIDPEQDPKRASRLT
jgi:hypothetical protein